MKSTGDWPAWACVVAGYGLSVLAAISAQATIRDPGRGEVVFQRLCGGCHGEANGSPVRRLPHPFDYDDDQVRATVREGSGEMPAFSSGQVSDAEIDAVAAFLRSDAPR
jgi:mono/diheme cytochrome c family protein